MSASDAKIINFDISCSKAFRRPTFLSESRLALFNSCPSWSEVGLQIVQEGTAVVDLYKYFKVFARVCSLYLKNQ